MGRLVLSLLLVFPSVALLTGCGGSSSSGTSGTVPASINLTPAISSLDLGTTLSVTASARNYAGSPVTLNYSWASSNPAVATVSTAGLVCAGVWDSLAAPVVCTPGATGTAQITATASGITSGPITVYVHPHVDHIAITALPQPPGVTAPQNGCFSTTSTTGPAETQSYQASATSNGNDISALVGPFTWSTTNLQVATVKELTGVSGVVNGQAELTAKVPGITAISASISNTHGSSGGPTSPVLTFETCPVQVITLALNTGGTTFTGAKGAGFNITPTVLDSNGKTVTGVPLTWTSTQPAIATVSTSGGVSNTNAGGASITAACLPPTCNIDLTTNSAPMQAVYAIDPIVATWSATSTTPTAPTVYVSSTGCKGANPLQNCTTAFIPVSGSPAALGSSGSTTNVPNSFRYDPKGTTAYVGSQNGLMQVSAGPPPSLGVLSTAVKGKILAVSVDARRVIVADTQDTPNQVFLYDATSTPATVTNFPITGGTAAAFSPDGLKAFIVAHDPAASPADHLYVYSAQMPLQTIPLAAQAFDITFPGNAMFGFLAGGAANGSSFLPVCDSAVPPGVESVGGSPGILIRQLPGNSMVVLDPPDLFRIDYSVVPSGTVGPTVVGCPPPPFGPAGGFLVPATTPSGPMSIGQGAFTPVAFNVSSDGQKAYILAANVSSLIIYDIASQTSSTIPLVGNPAPLAGTLAPDGLSFYVTGNDNNLHVINLVSGADVQQLSIPSNDLCAATVLPNVNPPTCLPDLLAVP